jgi:crotonobetainyl-CoA:carnitine CoA-transferase CaiB-like acyl-CoA transferase
MKREGRRAAGSAGAYPFTILQGKESPIAIMCPAVGEFKTLTEAMGSPEWSKDPRYQNPSEISRHYAEEVDAYVEAWISKLSDEEIENISLKYGIPLYPIRNVDRIVGDEQYGYRKFFKDISYGGKSYTIPGLPFSCLDNDGPIEKESDRTEVAEFAGFHACSAVAELLARHMHDGGRFETITDLSIGKDSEEILQGLGYTASQIDEFRRHDNIVRP